MAEGGCTDPGPGGGGLVVAILGMQDTRKMKTELTMTRDTPKDNWLITRRDLPRLLPCPDCHCHPLNLIYLVSSTLPPGIHPRSLAS